jgi:peptide/nickel transport system permease protein
LLVPQVLGVVTLTFLVVRVLPGNPVTTIAGPIADPTTVASITKRLGLDKPLYIQYIDYLKNVLTGDFGRSFFTGNEVTKDLIDRIPATVELITVSMLLIFLLALPLGVLAALPHRQLDPLRKLVQVYGLLAGSFPEFWWGLSLLFVFFFVLGWLPPPLGRIDPYVSAPQQITGSFLIDSSLSLDWDAFQSSLSHLILPVATMVLVFGAPVVKMAQTMTEEHLKSDYIRFAKACGLPTSVIVRYAVRNALPPVLSLGGFLYGYMIGGAVLVETVFSWGGAGQYAVEAVKRTDFVALQGFVLVAAMFSVLVYLVIDLIHMVIDPRVTY